MKRRKAMLIGLLSWLLAAAPAASPAADKPDKDIVDTALGAGQFKTLVAAVKEAGLVDTLKGAGPFTVFAPTDEAFAKLPQDKLAALLKDKQALTGVLTYHVVPGKVLAADVVKLDSAKTAQGKLLTIAAKEGKVRVNAANVIKTDIVCSNGVIHVIDAVLSPPQAAAPALKRIQQALADSAGVAPAARVAQLEVAARDVLRMAAANAFVKELLNKALADADGAALEAALRDAEIILSFRPIMEAKLPVGFPEPTPVGEVQLKSYPAYRLARTPMAGERGRGPAFFTLYGHIVRANIAMTAPVEITYRGAAREVPQGESMAFLYGGPDVGETGRSGKVVVSDVPAMQTISIGVQGDYNATNLAKARQHLEKWLKDNAARYEVAGPLRVMGYNSPMIPAERRYAEVEIPVCEK